MNAEHTKSMRDAIEGLKQFGPMNTIFEIGCDALEETTPLLRESFPMADMFCFDADPRNGERVSKSGADRMLGVSFFQMAVCDKHGKADFYLSTKGEPDEKDWALSSSLKRPKAFDGGGWLKWKEEPVEVFTTTLDDFCETSHGISGIDLLWIDVQSGEDLVLKGAKEMLTKTRVIFIEHCTSGDYCDEPGIDGIMALLPGWTIYKMLPYDAVLLNAELTHG